MFPWIYYLVSAGLLVMLISQCQPRTMSRRDTNPFQSDVVFLGLSFLLVVFMRLPSLLYNQELNPDESQTLAQTITLAQDPVYGRSVDGTTLGPINNYAILLLHTVGFPIDYTAARLTGLLLILLSLLFFYRGLRQFTTPVVSRITFLSAVLFFSFATHTDFLHYSSELTSLVILAVCFYGIVRQLRSHSTSWLALLSLGVVAGWTPYCKLQTLPIVGVMLLTLTAYLFVTHQQRAFRPILILSFGFLLPSIFVFSLAFWFNVDIYFINYYFIGNLVTYSQIYAHVPLVSQGFFSKLIRFPAFLARHSDFLIFIAFNCFLAVTGTLLLWARLRNKGQEAKDKTQPWVMALVLVNVSATLWCVITPGTEFGHHLLLLVFPFGWLMGTGLQLILDYFPSSRVYTRLAAIACAILVIDVLLTDNILLPYGSHLARRASNRAQTDTDHQLATNPHAWLSVRNPCLFAFPDKTHMVLSPVSRVINQYAIPSDKIAIWGWNCRPYVETQLASGVSEVHTQRSVTPNPMREQYVSRYARELRDNQPVLFLDAVGNASLLLREPKQRHEHFASVDSIIRHDYALVTTVEDVRVYVRRDRLSSRTHLAAQPLD